MRSFDHRLPATASEAELLALVAAAQRRPGGARHPGAAAAAAADRLARGDRGDRSGQGRRRLSPGQCRPAGDRAAGARALHAARLHACWPRRCIARSPGWRRWWSAAPTSSASRWRSCCSPRTHGHGRPFADARPAGGLPPRRHAVRGGRPAGNGERRLDQAGRDRHRRRHQPRAGRKRARRGSSATLPSPRRAGRRRDHAGAGRRRADDHRLLMANTVRAACAIAGCRRPRLNVELPRSGDQCRGGPAWVAHVALLFGAALVLCA